MLSYSVFILFLLLFFSAAFRGDDHPEQVFVEPFVDADLTWSELIH